MSHGERIAQYLLAIEAVKISVDPPFTWTSGLLSPLYCDNRMIYGHPEARDFIVSALVQRIQALHIPPDVIAGTAMGAIGWGALVADRLKLPFVYVRPKAKEHGRHNRIEGDLQAGKDIVLIEDLISTGSSSLSSVAALKTEGQCRVADVVSIFSYEFDVARESAREEGVSLHALSSLSTLLTVALQLDMISPAQSALIQEFAKDPQHWKQRT